MGCSGVRSPDARVSSKACGLFPRFVKLVQRQIFQAAAQVHQALRASPDLLAVPHIPSSLLRVAPGAAAPKVKLNGGLTIQDQAFLYEAVAIFIVAMPVDQAPAALSRLLEIPVSNIKAILAFSKQQLTTDFQGNVDWAARSVDTIAIVSKVFPNMKEADGKHDAVDASNGHGGSRKGALAIGCANEWAEAVTQLAQLLDRFAKVDAKGVSLASVWTAALFLCRRMVVVLNDGCLGAMRILLPIMYSGVGTAELIELTLFVHQVVNNFHARAGDFLEHGFTIFFRRPWEIWKGLPEDSVQLKREKAELAIVLLQFIRESSQRCPLIVLQFLSAGGDLSEALGSFLLAGLADFNEARGVIAAAQTWTALLEAPNLPDLPVMKIIELLLWSSGRVHPQCGLASKVVTTNAATLSAIARAKLPETLKIQVGTGLPQAFSRAFPGLRDEAPAQRVCELLRIHHTPDDVRAALQQCVSAWRQDASTM